MTKLYQANWSWNKNTDSLLNKLCKGRTLNFPCGMSMIGDVRADIDPKVNPDIVADLLKPYEHFKKLEFNTVLCDPPFSMFNEFKWILKIADLVQDRFILSTPPMVIHLSPKRWKKSYFVSEQGNLFLRIFQVFDRANHFLVNPISKVLSVVEKGEM